MALTAYATARDDHAAITTRLQPAQTPWTRGWRSWLLPLGMTAIGALLRWPHLGRPNKIMFDETYYAKDAYAMLTHGAEWDWKANADKSIALAHGDPSKIDNLFKETPAFIVHPPVGKWVIALGEHLFGMTPFGWRFMAALLGTLLILLTARLVLRITQSPAIAAFTGLFLAIDGVSIVMSRTALLDGTLTFWVMCAAMCVARDRDAIRGTTAMKIRSAAEPESLLQQWRSAGISFGYRPWLWAGGLCLGLAVATKWSALWHMAFFGLLVLFYGSSTRKLLGIKNSFVHTLKRDAVVTGIAFVVTVAVVYVASWAGWFATPGAYNRQWASTNAATGVLAFVPAAFRSWLHYHEMMWNFHVHLTNGHSYKANAWSWPIMGRPTSFYYETTGKCGAPTCSSEVTALGNPIIWWAGLLALLHQAGQWLSKRDFRAMFIVVGWLAGWLPWLLFQHRTIFTFYAIILIPFTCMALARSCVQILEGKDHRTGRAVAIASVVLAALAFTWFFLPVWTAQYMPYAKWGLRMWFATWI